VDNSNCQLNVKNIKCNIRQNIHVKDSEGNNKHSTNNYAFFTFPGLAAGEKAVE
jgi:hypothetical protein